MVEPQQNKSQDMDGLQEILQLFTSGTLTSYIDKFKSLVREVGQHPSTSCKPIKLVLEVCDMLMMTKRTKLRILDHNANGIY